MHQNLYRTTGPKKIDLYALSLLGRPLYVFRVSKRSSFILNEMFDIEVKPIIEDKTVMKYQLFLTVDLIRQLQQDSLGYWILPLPVQEITYYDSLLKEEIYVIQECQMIFDLIGFNPDTWGIFTE